MGWKIVIIVCPVVLLSLSLPLLAYPAIELVGQEFVDLFNNISLGKDPVIIEGNDDNNFVSIYPTLDDVPCAKVHRKKTRILNGEVATPHAYPWMALILLNGDQHCGGSLIDEMNILTAAHCFAIMHPFERKNITVILGEHNVTDDKNQARVTRQIDHVIFHEDFYPNYQAWFEPLDHPHPVAHDIAILRMKEKVDFTEHIQPICLSKNLKPDTYAGFKADVYGWGTKTKPNDSIKSKDEPKTTTLNTIQLPIWKMEDCRENYRNASHDDLAPIDSMICTGDGVRDSCKGDSGGPVTLASKNSVEQIGIVSWGISCGDSTPGVNTNVAYYRKWIEIHRQKSDF